jgi:hypothetical protein
VGPELLRHAERQAIHRGLGTCARSDGLTGRARRVSAGTLASGPRNWSSSRPRNRRSVIQQNKDSAEHAPATNEGKGSGNLAP